MSKNNATVNAGNSKYTNTVTLPLDRYTWLINECGRMEKELEIVKLIISNVPSYDLDKTLERALGWKLGE